MHWDRPAASLADQFRGNRSRGRNRCCRRLWALYSVLTKFPMFVGCAKYFLSRITGKPSPGDRVQGLCLVPRFQVIARCTPLASRAAYITPAVWVLENSRSACTNEFARQRDPIKRLERIHKCRFKRQAIQRPTAGQKLLKEKNRVAVRGEQRVDFARLVAECIGAGGTALEHDRRTIAAEKFGCAAKHEKLGPLNIHLEQVEPPISRYDVVEARAGDLDLREIALAVSGKSAETSLKAINVEALLTRMIRERHLPHIHLRKFAPQEARLSRNWLERDVASVWRKPAEAAQHRTVVTAYVDAVRAPMQDPFQGGTDAPGLQVYFAKLRIAPTLAAVEC